MSSNKSRGHLRLLRWVEPFIEEPLQLDDANAGARSKLPWITFLLTGLSSLGFAFSLLGYLKRRQPTALAEVVVWSVAIVAVILIRPKICSLFLTCLYVSQLLIAPAHIAWSTDRYDFDLVWDAVSILASLVSLAIMLNLPLRHPSLSRIGISQPFTSPTAQFRSPEDNLTMWQWMTVSWMSPLIHLGGKRQLNNDDVWQLAYEFQHTQLHEAFRSLTGSVLIRLLKANWVDLVLITLLSFLELAANYSAPVILQKLLQAMKRIDIDKKPAITWGFLTLAVEFAAAQSSVFSLWFGRRTYERARGEMITMLHEKVLNRQILGGMPGDESEKEVNGHALKHKANGLVAGGEGEEESAEEERGLISGTKKEPQGRFAAIKASLSNLRSYLLFGRYSSLSIEKEPASMGKILNLMRNDVYQVSQRFWDFQQLINIPFGLILSLVLVWRLIGWASLVGIGVIVISQLLNAIIARILYSWEKIRRKATDQKLQQISQYVEAIRHLRWYGWHARKLEKVLSARQRELNLNIVTFAWSSVITLVNVFASGILPVAAFWAYTALAGQDLTIDIAFPALQLFVLLEQNLQDVPNLIKVLLDASIALGRIEDFMSEADVATDSDLEIAAHLELKDASFAWPGTSKNVLNQISVVFPQGLTIIVGPVAAGKTALLQALLGELDLRDGRLIRPDTPMGYCAQTPWLESMTIRDNILFCSPYEEARYKHVVEACALLPDLASFKQGDLSPIGENGIGLSGGQKARVALARALYSRAKILLLDDPLSALDQQTAEWIVSRCLTGSLTRDRMVILVTHRTDLCMHISEQVVEVFDGQARVYQDTGAIEESELHLTNIESPPEQVKRANESAAIREKFEDEEHRAHGGVQLKVYWEYVKAGKLGWWFFVLLSAVFWRLFDYAQNWFLKEWGEAYKTSTLNLLLTVQSVIVRVSDASPIKHLFDQFPDPGVNPRPWLFWFMMLAIFQTTAFMTSQIFMIIITYTAGKNMFARIMVMISNATFLFYDVTPIGRLMNRLTGDVGIVDGPIAGQILGLAWEMIAWVSALVVIASVTPPFLVFSIGLTAAFVYIFLKFLPTSQSLRRLEMVSLSPLMSNFGALLTGLMTVRAFHVQPQFQARVIGVTDTFQKMDHFYWSLQSWLQYRFDCLSAISTFLLTILAIYSGLSPGLTAFVLDTAQRFVKSTHRLCKQYGQLQLDFVAVERVVELVHLEQEKPGSLPPPAYWPSRSSNNPAVEFENVTIRYAPHLDPALENISFSIPPGSSTALIGRTGSGKSTLALALLATIEPDSGRIFVDGIDVSQVSKQELRSRVTFLAQEPVLFEGTLRTNLDPMDDYSNSECVSVIKRIHGDTRYEWSLDTKIDAGGKNLSQGQRQLVGLARAILRRSALIIMDEATASVDLETSWEVQRVLKEELAGSTVITIAHRASAVRDCDLVVRLDKGRLAAFGKPSEVETGWSKRRDQDSDGDGDPDMQDRNDSGGGSGGATNSHVDTDDSTTEHRDEDHGPGHRVDEEQDVDRDHQNEYNAHHSVQHDTTKEGNVEDAHMQSHQDKTLQAEESHAEYQEGSHSNQHQDSQQQDDVRHQQQHISHHERAYQVEHQEERQEEHETHQEVVSSSQAQTQSPPQAAIQDFQAVSQTTQTPSQNPVNADPSHEAPSSPNQLLHHNNDASHHTEPRESASSHRGVDDYKSEGQGQSQSQSQTQTQTEAEGESENESETKTQIQSHAQTSTQSQVQNQRQSQSRDPSVRYNGSFDDMTIF